MVAFRRRLHDTSEMSTFPGSATPSEPTMPPLSEADVTVAGTEVERAVTCLRRVGVVLVRQAIATDMVAWVTTAVRQAYGQLPLIMSEHPGTESVLGELGLIAPDHVPHFPELGGMACRLVRESTAWPILEHYFRAMPLPVLDTLRFRRHLPPSKRSAVPLHQDVMFTGMEQTKVNCWVPLTSCGRNAPGLEFYPMYHLARFVHRAKPAEDAYPMDSIRPAAFDTFPSPLRPIEPEYRPGDMLIFDDFCPHRTMERPGMSMERLSFDIRYTFDGSKGPFADGLREIPPVRS